MDETQCQAPRYCRTDDEVEFGTLLPFPTCNWSRVFTTQTGEVKVIVTAPV